MRFNGTRLLLYGHAAEEELVEPNCIDYTPSSRTTSVRLRFDLVEMHVLRSLRPLAA
jgi:hypothetical protein